MADIHFVETSASYEKLTGGWNLWSSGTWTVSAKKAKSLVGGRIFLHTAQKGPSFLCGEILDYAVGSDKKVTFLFRHDRALVNTYVNESEGAWKQEQITIG